MHLIIDVNPNPKLIALMRAARIDPGDLDPERWQRAAAHLSPKPAQLKIAQEKPLTAAEKTAQGIEADGFATRILRTNLMARLLGAPLKPGDILVSADGVRSSAQSRSALDYIRTTYRPGQTVTLTILRDGRRIERRLRILPDHYHPRVFLDKLLHRGKAAEGTY